MSPLVDSAERSNSDSLPSYFACMHRAEEQHVLSQWSREFDLAWHRDLSGELEREVAVRDAQGDGSQRAPFDHTAQIFLA